MTEQTLTNEPEDAVSAALKTGPCLRLSLGFLILPRQAQLAGCRSAGTTIPLADARGAVCGG